ncbi:MAG TPA: cytochrome b N-terminal domain-containing protein [Solirubrobacterales bacterium]|nr:cytochrome b N-terminal domain-containing protein [Solirubrobacterales bacterium]
MIRRSIRFLDERSGVAPLLKKTLRYVFPDHWSFLLGEVALYAFIVLVATGVYLTFFFEPSTAKTVYHGSYAPLRGMEMSRAYASVVHLSFDVKAGLLIRQTHHWAADVFVAAIVLHLIRVFFTGAYRKPRELTYLIGIVMLFATLLEGYLGYSLIDDLLSGMGLAIGYGVALSIPFVGANLALLIWGHPFPGDPDFWSRMYIGHVLIMPLLIGGLLAAHLALVSSRHHTQFRRKSVPSERKLVGIPTFPGQVPRSLGLMIAVAGVLVLLGGLVQINPIWLWGPYHLYDGTNGAQPDWYLGWLIGALRLVPHFDVVVWNRTLVPNPFWGGALFPLVVMAALMAWPWLEKRATGDHRAHNVLDRPRDAPVRTGIGAGFLTWVVMIFMAGAADRLLVFLGVSYVSQLWFYRVGVWIVPIVVGAIAWRFCLALKGMEEVQAEQEAAVRSAQLD